MDRASIKRQAKDLIQANRPKILVASLIFLVISGVISFLSYQLTGPSPSEVQGLMQASNSGDYQRIMAQYEAMRPNGVESLVSDVLTFLSSILAVGFMILLLRMVRRQEYANGNLLDGFSIWWKIILLNILMGIFIALWSLLLVVPGIIAAYKYRMATYLLITHPEYSLMDCIRESKKRMDGHKGEMFVLDLSFLGWLLLTAIPVIGWILSIWVTPYIDTTNLLYYESISADYDPVVEDEPLSF